MAVWPFTHDWSSSLTVTYSFATTVLTTYSGLEQRIATRVEPRKTVATAVTLEHRTISRTLDRFIWTVQASIFLYTDPTTGVTSQVRLADAQTVDHPTNGISVANVTLAAEPGTDTYAVPVLTASTYAGRYIFPFPLHWGEGTPEVFSLPRQTVDYGRGRIAVKRPVAFATRTSTLTLQRIGLGEVQSLVDFFVYMRGRQGEFWLPMAQDELYIRETVSTTMRVAGTDAAGMFSADTVNVGVRVELRSGAVYFRRVTAAVISGLDSLLTLDRDIPDTVDPTSVRQASWLRMGRFASDDLVVEWLANPVAQTQVQVKTLPYSNPEGGLASDEMQDYYGTSLDQSFALRDYTVNGQVPRLYYGSYSENRDYTVNTQIARLDTW